MTKVGVARLQAQLIRYLDLVDSRHTIDQLDQTRNVLAAVRWTGRR